MGICRLCSLSIMRVMRLLGMPVSSGAVLLNVSRGVSMVCLLSGTDRCVDPL